MRANPPEKKLMKKRVIFLLGKTSFDWLTDCSIGIQSENKSIKAYTQ